MVNFSRLIKNGRILGSKSEVAENGSAILEFILFLTLLIIPLIIFFTNVTLKSNEVMREEVLFREIIKIIKSGNNFTNSISIANRFLSLHNSTGILYVSCIAGDCPAKESRMSVVLRTRNNLREETLHGGRWG